MKKTFILFSVFVLAASRLLAQYNTDQNKVWAFGEWCGVDFSSGAPTAFSTSIYTAEGCAAVSDATGHLLFYTNGDTVFTRTGVPMPNGCHIVPYHTFSCSQAAVIVQVIGSAYQYYVFSLEEYNGSIGYCHLKYSIVDMSLNGGYGDVVTTAKGKKIDSNFAEKMVAVLGDSSDIWLLTHQLNYHKFFAYRITSAGINLTPVPSNVGTFYNYLAGVIKIAPNRKKLVCQVNPYSPASSGYFQGTEMYDFDPKTGIVSNCQVIDSVNEQYGAEFSPDGTKLYTHEETAPGGIYTYDLSLPSPLAVITSKKLIHSGGFYKDLKLAPDDKIYVSNFGNTGLDCISNPNSATPSYTVNAVMMHSGNLCGIGLPNVAVGYWLSPMVSGIEDNGEHAALSVFPNPAKGEITINATGLAGNSASIICYSTVGTIVARQTVPVNNSTINASLNLSSLPRGIYEVRMQSGNSACLVKTIVLQ